MQVVDQDSRRRFGLLALRPGKINDRFGAEGRGISIYLLDPEGNTVELKGAKE